MPGSTHRHYEEFDDPMKAAKGADLITTDVWTSMGDESEDAERKRDEAWRVDKQMMRGKEGRALRAHCLPAHRGEEVAAEVIDGSQSVVGRSREPYAEGADGYPPGRIKTQGDLWSAEMDDVGKVVLAYSGG